ARHVVALPPRTAGRPSVAGVSASAPPARASLGMRSRGCRSRCDPRGFPHDLGEPVMPMHLPDDARDAALDALVALPDAGSGTGSVELRTGSQPAPGGEATGTLLATFTLPATTFGAASGGTATANAIDATTGVDDGEIGWFRVLDSDGN